MEDVKNPMDAAPQAVDAVEPASQETPVMETPNNVPPVAPESKAPEEQPEKMVPLSALHAERSMRKELARKMAEYEARMQNIPQSEDGMTWEQVMAHPQVQQMILEKAERDLKDFAREELDKRPGIPDGLRKAILHNPRGWVQPTTTDIENAKLDLLDAIDALDAGQLPASVGKSFPVAPTNAPASKTAGNSAEVQKILAKPPEDWTDEEAQIVDEELKSQPKR